MKKFIIKIILRVDSGRTQVSVGLALSEQSESNGFVALFAVLITAIILALTIGLTNIAYKEATLASSAKDGARAFFAADTGSECGLYADSKNAFTTGASFECAGDDTLDGNQTDSNGFKVFHFEINSGIKKSCVYVRVKKGDTEGAVGTETYTRIISEGYNISCDDVDSLDSKDIPHAVSRVIRVSYQEAAPGLPS